MKILSNKTVDVRDASLALLTPIQQVNMLPDKVVVFDSFDGIGLESYFNIRGAVLLLVKRGTCSVELNLEKHLLSERSCLIALPDQIARLSEIGDDLEFVCAACSQAMVEELMPHVNGAFSLVIKVKRRPVLKLDAVEYDGILRSFDFLAAKIRASGRNPHDLRIVQSAMLALAYECVGVAAKSDDAARPSSRKGMLFDSFIELVSRDHRREHGVAHYASRLFVTPKYLTRVVEEISHKSAKRWIDEYIALEAKTLLRSTRKGIQEISDELNFADMGFFGKFFKRMTGMSPKAYRDSGD